MLRITTRSVRRYLRELALVTELESIEVRPGGAHLWRIKPSERGRTVALRRTQAYALLASRRVFDPIRGSALFDEIDVALRQVEQVAHRPAVRTAVRGEAASDARLEERFAYVPPAPRAYANRGEDVDELFQAVAELRVLRFRYREGAAEPARTARTGGSAARASPATPTPSSFTAARSPAWPATSTAGAARAFLFDRMTDLEASTGERFELPARLRDRRLAAGGLRRRARAAHGEAPRRVRAAGGRGGASASSPPLAEARRRRRRARSRFAQPARVGRGARARPELAARLRCRGARHRAARARRRHRARAAAGRRPLCGPRERMLPSPRMGAESARPTASRVGSSRGACGSLEQDHRRSRGGHVTGLSRTSKSRPPIGSAPPPDRPPTCGASGTSRTSRPRWAACRRRGDRPCRRRRRRQRGVVPERTAPRSPRRSRELNRLIVAHNRYYPIEANLPLDPVRARTARPRRRWMAPCSRLPAVTLRDVFAARAGRLRSLRARGKNTLRAHAPFSQDRSR